ncbi:hypothetical protein UY3_04227 [Chelonia mydas]|uniref:Myb/SANT-like DNA-binding domain-containing protein n=1 Tax=Chelonia mydas TaxID=8469 RepID=M7C2F2_CHEMY|nr:hypothetical protein UY3_04227 [Chelonia mydas]
MQSPQNRKRAPAWSERETLDLIAVWREESVQVELRSKRRNANIYAKIAQGMVERGYNRDTQQCSLKVKELRGDPTTTPTLSMDTRNGGVSRNTEEDFVDEEEEEEEENAQQASGESIFPGSQDLFITLEPTPSQGRFPDPEGREELGCICGHYSYWKSLLTCLGMERESSRDISIKLSWRCKCFYAPPIISVPEVIAD